MVVEEGPAQHPTLNSISIHCLPVTSSCRLKLVCSLTRLSTRYAKEEWQCIPGSMTSASIRPGDLLILKSTLGWHTGSVCKVSWSFLLLMALVYQRRSFLWNPHYTIDSFQRSLVLLLEPRSIHCAIPERFDKLRALGSTFPSLCTCCKKRPQLHARDLSIMSAGWSWLLQWRIRSSPQPACKRCGRPEPQLRWLIQFRRLVNTMNVPLHFWWSRPGQLAMTRISSCEMELVSQCLLVGTQWIFLILSPTPGVTTVTVWCMRHTTVQLQWCSGRATRSVL